MKNNKGKIALICWSVGTVLSTLGLILAFAFGVGLGVACAIVFIVMCVLGIISSVLDIKGLGGSFSSPKRISKYDKELLNKFIAIKDDEYNDVNYVSFANDGLKFAAKGKYGCIKDFNGKKGYHLGFNIEGLELVDQPEGYEDIVGYESLLFNIEIGYFDGFLLSTPENDNGIVVSDLENLEGKTIQIQGNNGYTATIRTAEWDDIDVGEIKFVEWKENSKIIKFKLVVGYGLGEVVVGTVQLTEDN